MATLLFYLLAVLALLTTLLCLTRRSPVYAVLYLVQTLFALSLLYYLLGAPLLAAWQVILYAGAVMIMFLFVIMLLDPPRPKQGPAFRPLQWLPAGLSGILLLSCGGALLFMDPSAGEPVGFFRMSPRVFGQALFERYGLAVEIVSLILLFAAVGAFHLGRRSRPSTKEDVS